MASPIPEGSSEEEDMHQQQQHVINSSHRYLAPSPFKPSQEHQHLAAATSKSLATAAAAAACVNPAVVSHSVVPDLMRVYESMTQSSTPSHPLGSQQLINAAYRQQAVHSLYQDQQDASMYYQAPQHQQGWTYGSTTIPIPPPYPLPLQSDELSSRRTRNSTTSVEVSSASGRSLRKRNAIEENNGGYASSTGSSSRGAAKSRRKGGSKKGSIGSDKAKDDKTNDGRWSKRFSWPEDLHRDFVSAIFDVGLKHSSPSTVMEHMPAHEQITTERIKSHLQKYRLHRQKSKKDFMSSYSATVQKLNAEGMDGVTVFAGGEVAGHLTYSTLTQPDPEVDDSDNTQSAVVDDAVTEPQSHGVNNIHAVPAQAVQEPQPDVFVLPRLTEAEKQSPIGTSLGYLLGLFFSLKQQLDRQRQEQQEIVAAAAAAQQRQEQEQLQLQQQQRQQDQECVAVAVFDSFVSEQNSPQQTSKKVGVAAAASGAAIVTTVPSTTRSNLEENSIMKREMKNQMEFQNKMRALKQQELNKYNNKMSGVNVAHAANADPVRQETTTNTASNVDHGVQTGLQHKPQQEYQGAGETGGADTAGRERAGETGGADTAGRERNQSMSLADDDDFWNTAVVDDELFDFLMNN
jgi:SHAQKYF class myb-like DNA-binding protein